MKLTKIILILVAVLAAAWLINALVGVVVGVVLNLLWYVAVLAVLGAGGYFVYKRLGKRQAPLLEKPRAASPPLLDSSRLDRDLARTDRLLEDYKNKIASEK